MPLGPLIFAAIVSVVDGDTFHATIHDREQETIRVLGVDTPELHGQCEAEVQAARSARTFVRDRVGDAVLLRPGRRDKYGRLLAHVILLDGSDLAVGLIEAGHGRAYHGERREGWC